MYMVLEGGAQDEARPERTDLVTHLERMRRYVGEATKRDSVEITLYTEKPRIYVYMSQLALMRVFYQLFENALKYMDGGRQIAVRAYCVEETQVLVVFKNDGQGLPQNEAKRALEKGFRGSNSKRKTGEGFGLAEVKQIMERYGGSVETASREDSGFSVFLIFRAYQEKGK